MGCEFSSLLWFVAIHGTKLMRVWKVARTISRLEETSLPLEGSLGAARGMMASRTTPLVMSFSFSATSICSASLGGLLKEETALVRLSLLGSISLGAISTVELKEPDAWMAGG